MKCFFISILSAKAQYFQGKEVEHFIKQLKIRTTGNFSLKPCTNIDIVRRLINNLIYSYDKTRRYRKNGRT